MTSTEEPERRHPTVEERIHTWSVQQFCLLGFNELQAERLIDDGVNWHEAERLVKRRQCPVHLAFDLLSE